jgi:hypothetical protein
MKCLQCGFPLSPTRTICPRCGANNGKGAATAPRFAPGAAVLPPSQPATGQDNRFGGSNVDLATPQPQWGAPPQTPTFPQAEGAGYYPSALQEQAGFFGNDMGQPQNQLYLSPSPFAEQVAPVSFSFTPSAATLPPLQPPRPAKRSHSPQFGFTIAGLCLISGALLLVFVYFMSIGLLSRPTNNQAANSSTATKAATPTVLPSPSPIVSPTPNFPGQQYITNVQMASAINTTTAQTITPTTTFQVGQRMYVTFLVHTMGASGGVCLLWYINNTLFTSYDFSVPSDTSAYSYAASRTAGTGNVEIYWTTRASCLDPNKVLGQRVSFTVTA